MSEKRKKRIAVVDTAACVACGCCVKACRLGAMGIFYGMYAHIDATRCVGCGACAAACPASAIVTEEAGT